MADNLNKILYNYYMAEIKNYYRKITELLPIRFKLFIKNLEKDFLSAMKKENIKLQFANFTILFLKRLWNLGIFSSQMKCGRKASYCRIHYSLFFCSVCASSFSFVSP